MSLEPQIKAKSYGQVAFEAYRKHRGGVNHDGAPTPVWLELTEEIRAAWDAAATAAIAQVSRDTAYLTEPAG